jgi:hypothetical protein
MQTDSVTAQPRGNTHASSTSAAKIADTVTSRLAIAVEIGGVSGGPSSSSKNLPARIHTDPYFSGGNAARRTSSRHRSLRTLGNASVLLWVEVGHWANIEGRFRFGSTMAERRGCACSWPSSNMDAASACPA